MKQLKLLSLSTLLVSLLIISCTEDDPEIKITDFSFSTVSVEVKKGTTVDLSDYLTIAGEDASKAEVVFTTDNEDVVTVDGSTLSAVAIGDAVIEATETNTNKTATIDVTVVANLVATTGVILDKTEADLKVGESFQLTATVAPENASEKGVTWSVAFPSEAKAGESSPTDIASVSDNGLVTAKAAGDVVVTATTKDEKFTASATISITNVTVTQITIAPESVAIDINATEQLTATVLPENATIKDVVWSVDFDATAGRTQIAGPTVDFYLEISEDGLLKAKERCDGCAFIARATSAENEVTSFITVGIHYVPVTKIILDPNELFTIFKGETRKMEYTVIPENASDPVVSSWNISNTMSQGTCGLSSINYDDYATVDNQGLITAVNPFNNDCQDNLIVEAHHPDLSSPASAEFDVTLPVTSLTILDQDGNNAGASLGMPSCSDYQLGLLVSPSQASKGVTWSSENTNLLIVGDDGYLEFGSGVIAPTNARVKITVTANDGSGVTDSIDVTINYNGC